jgi:hypothetical protein
MDFFQAINISIDEILKKHQSVKELRAEKWGAANKSNPSKYNLFMDNTKQVLNYAVFRWGVPLALPYLLEKDALENKRDSALTDHLESFPSAEIMSREIKDHNRYGLGKAIGDKACHLFAKWMVRGFHLTHKTDNPAWGAFSFEVPFDSNAGRVLWRTGYLLGWASEGDYQNWQVVQRHGGKGGKHYIRVTNIRGRGATHGINDEIREIDRNIAVNHLMTHKKAPQKVEIQRIQHALLFKNKSRDLGPAEFDEGLIHIGTKYCFNHGKPNCHSCPVKALCQGYQNRKGLIEDYRT